MVKKKYDVLGIGNALMDYEILVEDSFLSQHKIEKGMMTLVEEKLQFELIASSQNNIKNIQPGGSIANSVVALSQLGGKAHFVGSVAHDDDGSQFHTQMNNLGISTQNSYAKTGVTGKCLVMVTPDSERTMNTYLGVASDISEDYLDENIFSQTQYLFIEGYLVSAPKGMATIEKAKKIARDQGVKIAYTFSDPSMVKFFKSQTESAVSGSLDLLFANQEEAQLFTQTTSKEAAFEALKSHAHHFVMTLGALGAWIFDGKNKIVIPPRKVIPLDTTGAGDMFAGAYLYGLTQNISSEKAGTLASHLSSEVVQNYGPRLQKDKVLKIRQKVLK